MSVRGGSICGKEIGVLAIDGLNDWNLTICGVRM